MKASSPVPKPTSLEDQVDRLGELRRLISEHSPLVREEKQLTADILAQHAHWKPSQAGRLTGHQYYLDIGMCAEQQSMVPGGMAQVFKWLKREKFIDLCKITLENLKSNLDARQYAAVIRKTRTGSRSTATVAKAAIAGA